MNQTDTDVIQGTLDMLILKTLSLAPLHGYGITRRIEQVSMGVFKVNPGSLILSGAMLLRWLGWGEAADAVERALETTIGQKRVTYDLERQMEGAQLLKTSEFAQAVVENL